LSGAKPVVGHDHVQGKPEVWLFVRPQRIEGLCGGALSKIPYANGQGFSLAFAVKVDYRSLSGDGPSLETATAVATPDAMFDYKAKHRRNRSKRKLNRRE